MQWIIADNMPLLYRPPNTHIPFYYSVGYVQSLGWEELGPLSLLVYLVLSPYLLEVLVLDVLEISCWLSHLHLVPDCLQLALAGE